MTSAVGSASVDAGNIGGEAKSGGEEKKEEEKPKAEEPPPIDIDELIVIILNIGTPDRFLELEVKCDTITQFCSIAKESFSQQPFMIEINGPVKSCGDTHGQFSDVLRLLDRIGFPP